MKKLKKIFIRTVVIVAISLFIVLNLLRLEYIQQKIVLIANKNLNKKVSLEYVDISYLNLKFIVDNLFVEDNNKRIIDLKKVIVDLSTLPLFYGEIVVDSLIVKSPTIDAIMNNEGILNLTEIIDSSNKEKDEVVDDDEEIDLPNIDLKKFRLENLDLNYLDMASGQNISLDTLSIKLRGKTKPLSLTMDLFLNKTTLGSGDKSIDVDQLYLNTQLEKESALLNLDFKNSKKSLSVNGNVKNIFKDPYLDININSYLDISELSYFLPNNIGGKLNADIKIFGSETDLNSNIFTSVKNIRFDTYSMDSLKFKSTLKKEVFTINDCGIYSDKGSIDVVGETIIKGLNNSFNVDLENISYNLDLKLNRFSPEKCGVEIEKTDPILSGSVVVNGVGVIPQTLKGSVESNITVSDIENSIDSIGFKGLLTLEKEILKIENSKANLPGTDVTIEGRGDIFGKNISLNLDVNSKNFQKISELIGMDLRTEGINSTISINKENDVLKSKVDFTGKGLGFEEYNIGDINISLNQNSDSLYIDSLTLKNKQSFISLRGKTKVLKGLAIDNNPAFSMDLKGELNIKDFANSFGGNLLFGGSVKGDLKNRFGSLNFALKNPKKDNISLNKIDGKVLFNRDSVFIDNLGIYVDSLLNYSVNLFVTDSKDFNFEFKTENSFDPQKTFLKSIADLDFKNDINIVGFGNLENPKVKGSVALDFLSLNSIPFDPVALTFNLKKSDFNLDMASPLKGRLDLDLASKNFKGNFARDKFLLDNYLANFGFENSIGNFDLGVNFKGNLDTIEKMEGGVTLDKLYLRLFDNETVADGIVDTEIKGLNSIETSVFIDLTEENTINISAEYDSSKISADGKIEVTHASINPLVDELDVRSGKLSSIFFARISEEEQKYSLKALIEDFTVNIKNQDILVDNFGGRISIDEKDFLFENFGGNIGSGNFLVKGKGKMYDMLPKGDLTLSLNTLPIEIPGTASTTLNGEVKAKLDRVKCFLNGDIEVVDALFYQQIDFDVLSLLMQSKPKQAFISKKEDTILDSVLLNLGVSYRKPLVIDNNVAFMELEPDITIKGKASSPVINGNIKIPNGKFDFQKRDFIIKNGNIELLNPYKTDPNINILAKGEINEYEINLLLNGKLENMEVSFTSNPYLEDSDIISLILTGKTISGALGDGNRDPISAEALLINMINNNFGDDIKRSTGLDQFSLKSGNDGDISLNIGKNLSERLKLLYTMENNKDGNNYITATHYRILEHLSLVGYKETKGGFGGGLRFKWEFR